MDNLNRATTIGGVSRTYDDLGNTLTIGSSKTMTWDVLNRMASYSSSPTFESYTYRADGLRVAKYQTTNPGVHTDYAYDGQMPVEEFYYRSTYPILTMLKFIRYGLGARGIERIERTTASNVVTVGYPIYDAHGNNVATLQASGGSCTLSDQRGYDVWGGIRTGAVTGEPNARYCANLGHLQDDESGFVYMRARYYEPEIGRFLTEDPASQGWNWYTYCGNRPTSRCDDSGMNDTSDFVMHLGFVGLLLEAC